MENLKGFLSFPFTGSNDTIMSLCCMICMILSRKVDVIELNWLEGVWAYVFNRIGGK